MMAPLLLRWGPFELHSFGLLAGVAFLAVYFFLQQWAPRRGVAVDPALDSLSWAVGGGLLGARALYVLVHFSEFQTAWWEIPMVWRGGLMWHGGLLGGVGGLWWFARRSRTPFLVLADLYAPALALGQAIGRVGCFLAGCCYGRVCDKPWAVVFQHPEGLAPLNTPLHPTQLYDAAFQLSLWGTLLVLSQKPSFAVGKGRQIALYLALAALGRVILETFRGDDRGALGGPWTVTNLLAVAFAGAAGLWLYRKPRP